MDERTLEALKGSIAKWEAIVAGTGDEKGVNNCPLCQLFNGPSEEANLGCKGCPVADASGDTGCLNTPYEHWTEAPDLIKSPDGGYMIGGIGSRILAQAELNFLRSLLPASAIEAEGGDPQGLRAEHESAAPEGGDAQGQS
ncbi:MAG TPA: hypothetical protein VEA36_03680 [Candidatus Paceibacterota bacterium]|nr:hypothetical protein [Candidatus Paceibacterota bacterium]